jgi:hypothetical protein
MCTARRQLHARLKAAIAACSDDLDLHPADIIFEVEGVLAWLVARDVAAGMASADLADGVAQSFRRRVAAQLDGRRDQTSPARH